MTLDLAQRFIFILRAAGKICVQAPPMINLFLFAIAVLAAFAPILSPAFAVFTLALFFAILPGYCLLKLIRVEFETLSFVFACAVLSYLIATHAIYWISLTFGYSNNSIMLAFILTALPLLFIRHNLDIRKQLSMHMAQGIAASIIVFTIVFLVAALSMWRETENGIINGGWNWSDLGYHLSIITTINNGNFPPQAPFFAGEPFNYHWFCDFVTAISSKISGTFPAFVMRFETAFFAMLSFLGSYILALKLGVKKETAVLCAFLILFGGGLGWLKLIELAGTAPLPQLIANHSFDNSWEEGWGPYRIPSVFGTTIMTWRASASGFPAFLLCLFLLFEAFGGREISARKLFTAGLVAGLAAPFNFFASIACTIAFALFAVCDFISVMNLKRITRYMVFLIPLLFALPFMIPMLSNGNGAFKINLGWEAQKDSAFGFAWFYLANFGVPLLLALPGLLIGKIKNKWMLAGLALAFFAVPNAVSLTYITWDMCKMFAFMWVPLCILAGGFVERLPRWSWLIILVPCVLSPILVALWMMSSTWVAYSWDQMAVAYWIESNTPNDAIFVTPAMINQPTDVAGRLRLLTFPPYAANTGIDPSTREADLKRIYCGSESDAISLMEKYGASYIIGDYNAPNCSLPYEKSTMFRLAFQSGNISVYEFLRPTKQ